MPLAKGGSKINSEESRNLFHKNSENPVSLIITFRWQ